MYTYRYSKERNVEISWICPICHVKETIELNYESDIKQIHKADFTISRLCCSDEHTQEYEQRIKQAIKWCRDAKSTRLSREDSIRVYTQHYNRIPTKGRSKYNNIATVLANLSEYFPFNPKGDK